MRLRTNQAGIGRVDGEGNRFASHLLRWSEDEAKIAQLELMIVLMTIAHATAHFRGKPGIRWIDNIAALMAVARGRSSNSDRVGPDGRSYTCYLVLCKVSDVLWMGRLTWQLVRLHFHKRDWWWVAPSAWFRRVYICTLPAAFATALPDYHQRLLIPLSPLGCRVLWVDSLRPGMDHVPGIGSTGWGWWHQVWGHHTTQRSSVWFDFWRSEPALSKEVALSSSTMSWCQQTLGSF